MKKKQKKSTFILLGLLAIAYISLDSEVPANKENTIDPDAALALVKIKAQEFEFQKTGKLKTIIKNYPL